MGRGAGRDGRQGRHREWWGWSGSPEAFEWSGFSGQDGQDGQEGQEGYDGSAPAQASLWEVELEAVCAAEAAGRAGDLGQVTRSEGTDLVGQVGAGFETGREEGGPCPS